ncbi:MAG: DUF4388 domain-containing protein [Thermus sp.]
MSLFGNLRSLPLEELLQLLAQKEGALEIWNVRGVPATTLYLKPGRLRSLDQGGKPLDPLDAKAALQALLLAREGSFEFRPGARPPYAFRLNWPLERLLLGLIAFSDELAHLRPPPSSSLGGLPRGEASPGARDLGEGAGLLGKGPPRLRQGPPPRPWPGFWGCPWTWCATGFTSWSGGAWCGAPGR